MVVAYCLLRGGGWKLVFDCWMVVVGCRWCLVVGWLSLVVDRWLLVVDCWWLVDGRWCLVVNGCWWSNVGGWLVGGWWLVGWRLVVVTLAVGGYLLVGGWKLVLIVGWLLMVVDRLSMVGGRWCLLFGC